MLLELVCRHLPIPPRPGGPASGPAIKIQHLPRDCGQTIWHSGTIAFIDPTTAACLDATAHNDVTFTALLGRGAEIMQSLEKPTSKYAPFAAAPPHRLVLTAPIASAWGQLQ